MLYCTDCFRYACALCYIPSIVLTLGVKTWLSTLETVYLLWGVVARASSFNPHRLCLSDETL